MNVESRQLIDWERISFARARVLAGLEDQQTEQQIADRLGVALTTVRSQVEVLKAATGCQDVKELGKWWREKRDTWTEWCVAQARLGADNEKFLPPVGFHPTGGTATGRRLPDYHLLTAKLGEWRY